MAAIRHVFKIKEHLFSGSKLIVQEKAQTQEMFGLFKIWWPEAGSNRRHTDFQSVALPTELSGQESVY